MSFPSGDTRAATIVLPKSALPRATKMMRCRAGRIMDRTLLTLRRLAAISTQLFVITLTGLLMEAQWLRLKWPGPQLTFFGVKNMSPTQLKADILNNVDKLPSLSGKLITGGRLDMCKAVP